MIEFDVRGGESVERKTLVCANSTCDKEFVPKTHNMIYCDDECCRQATNRRIMEKYHANRARLKGKVRLCKKCETTKLSRYNESEYCALCTKQSEIAKNSSVLDMIMNSSIILDA